MKKIVLAILSIVSVSSLARAQVWHNNDVIVDGNSCIGLGCFFVFEDFQFEDFQRDTIRLKEPNLRIKFMDTSNSASFPRNDWQIRINSSANGGANAFLIDDMGTNNTTGQAPVATPFRIDAGATNSALVIREGGRIGFGTATPVVQLHLVSNETPTLRLEQDGSSGFARQSWDIGGNEENFFVRNATFASTLPLRIQGGGAPTNSLYIAKTGRIGMGTSAPSAKLHLVDSRPPEMLFENSFNATRWKVGIGIVRPALGPPPTAFDFDDFVITKLAAVAPPGTAPAPAGEPVTFGISSEGDIFLKNSQIHPDFVFEPDYELMPLEDLEAFIERERRLPGVQSGDEVREGALNVTALQRQLLQKVEELTLYLLDQHQQITALGKQNELIRGENQELAERLGRLERLR